MQFSLMIIFGEQMVKMIALRFSVCRSNRADPMEIVMQISNVDRMKSWRSSDQRSFITTRKGQNIHV